MNSSTRLAVISRQSAPYMQRYAGISILVYLVQNSAETPEWLIRL